MTGARALSLLALAVGMAFVAVSGPVRAQEPIWRPAVSERLVRLPAGYLEKAVEQDFRDSALATALDVNGAELAGRTSGLTDLQAAAEVAEGIAAEDAQHRFLIAKQEYLRLMGHRHDLDRRRIETQLTLYERLLARIEHTGDPGDDPALASLAEKRSMAIERFENAVDTVDMALFAQGEAAESRYSAEYRKHARAIEDLVDAINAHPMNAAPEIDGETVDKAEYLRHLITQTEAEAALLDQRELVLAYMAKLVALDALALADRTTAREDFETGRPAVRDVTEAVSFFTDRR